MTKFGFLIVFIIVLVIAGIGFLILQPRNEATKPITENENISGCYVATLDKDVYVLNIEEGDSGAVSGMIAYNNFQKDSSSGSFTGTYADGILSGIYSFDSEGMHSDNPITFKKVGQDFVQGFGPTKTENGKVFIDPSTITFDSKSTFIKSSDCVKHFKEANGTFSLDHNAFFQSFETELIPSLDWRLDAKQNGVILANVTIQKAYMPNTNFMNARLTVGRSSDPEAIKSCFALPQGRTEEGNATISGYPFKKFHFSGAGAGNYYDTTTYAGIFDGDCYAIEYTIHSTNVGNYSPDQGIVEFDKSKIQNELEKIVSSFKFLISSN